MFVLQLLFSTKKIFAIENFSGGTWGSKHDKFKSKKQQIFDLNFLHEAYKYRLVNAHNMFEPI